MKINLSGAVRVVTAERRADIAVYFLFCDLHESLVFSPAFICSRDSPYRYIKS